MTKKKQRQPVRRTAYERSVPPAGDDRRAWIRYELQKRQRPDGKRYTQADVAREAFANESSVSLVFAGAREKGPKVDKIRRITARILDLDTEVLFGVPLGPGDGYPGSPNFVAERD